MHRIDQPTAVTSLPTPAAAGTPGYFSSATPGSGTPTVVDNDWCNDIQEELISILTAAGVTPSKTTHNQVLTSIQTLFPFTKSLTAQGYQKLPGGLIIQWGSGVISSSGQVINFNITFPNAIFSVSTNDNGGGSKSVGCTPSTTGLTVFSSAYPVQLGYIAIGY